MLEVDLVLVVVLGVLNVLKFILCPQIFLFSETVPVIITLALPLNIPEMFHLQLHGFTW